MTELASLAHLSLGDAAAEASPAYAGVCPGDGRIDLDMAGKPHCLTGTKFHRSGGTGESADSQCIAVPCALAIHIVELHMNYLQ